MNRRLWIVLLLFTVMLGSSGIFWSKPALSNTESSVDEVEECPAEPWDDDFYQSSSPSHPGYQTLNNAQSQVKTQNVQKSFIAEKINPGGLRRKSVDRNRFHGILHTLWEVIFPESS